MGNGTEREAGKLIVIFGSENGISGPRYYRHCTSQSTVLSQYIVCGITSYMIREIYRNKYRRAHDGRGFPEIFM